MMVQIAHIFIMIVGFFLIVEALLITLGMPLPWSVCLSLVAGCADSAIKHTMNVYHLHLEIMIQISKVYYMSQFCDYHASTASGSYIENVIQRRTLQLAIGGKQTSLQDCNF